MTDYVYLVDEYDDMDGYYGCDYTRAVCKTEERAERWLEDYANDEMIHIIESENWYKRHVPDCLSPEYHIRDFSIRKEVLYK